MKHLLEYDDFSGQVSDENMELLEKNVPTNKELWAECKRKAKAKFDVYPSAYANSWACKLYKERGGKWKKAKKNESLSEYSDDREYDADDIFLERTHGGLDKWFDEKWVNIAKKNKDGSHPPCGREDASKGGYPKCRKQRVAAKMTDKEKKNATARKRRKEKTEKRDGKKPIYSK